MPENAIIRQIGDTVIAIGHDRGRWLWAAGSAFPTSAMPQPHAGALFFRTDLAAHYSFDGTTWLIVGGGSGGAHATSHQDGGTDEISVAGLSGLLADAQTPLAHTHAEADVTGLVSDLLAGNVLAHLALMGF